jgi:metal-responsive CopG/Arc/MetJ family transcriptional regulator
MKTFRLKLPDPLYDELEVLTTQLCRNRNSYINDAIVFYNKVQRRAILSAQLEVECALVRDADYAILQEMEGMGSSID